jgi:hypothetical protein
MPTFTIRHKDDPDDQHPLAADRLCVKNGYWFGPSAVDPEQRVMSGPLAGQWSATAYDAFDEQGNRVDPVDCSDDEVRGT